MRATAWITLTRRRLRRLFRHRVRHAPGMA